MGGHCPPKESKAKKTNRENHDTMNEDLIKKVSEELSESLVGGIISKIDQPGPRHIVLRVFRHGRTRMLLVSTLAPHERLHLTDTKAPNPMNPPRFCALLRSRIRGARIAAIRKAPHERIVEIDLLKKAGEGDSGTMRAFTLRVELTGRSSNIILLNEKGLVVDALRHFDPGLSPRGVMPGLALASLPERKAVPHGEEGIGGALPEKQETESWNEYAARVYTGLTGDETETAYRRELRRVIEKAVKKTRKKIRNLESDRARALVGVELTHLGELILPNMGQIRRGAREARVMDYTTTPPVEVRVTLDEKLGPRENAEQYFKKAKKARRALKMLALRIPATEAGLEDILSLGHDLDRARGVEELGRVEEALIKAGYMRPEEGRERGKARAPGHGRGGAASKGPVKKFKSSEGLLILLGRNARGNDLIVKKEASRGDIWLHAKDAAGSHALIKTGGRDISNFQATLREAASLAAWHSKARAQKKAEVLYTDVKHVTKPVGAKPGMVRVREFRVILVEPKEREK